jgi:phosphoserine phosphatase
LTTLLLIRHGETEWNAQRRVQGQTNSPLSARGRLQAQAVAARLSGIPLHAIYSSDLSRALDTASPIADARHLSIIPLSGLREKSYGIWEGLTETEIEAVSPDGWRRYHGERQWDYAIPGGETWEQVQTRILAVLAQILANHPYAEDTVAVIGHGASLRPVILEVLGAPLPSLLRLRLDNASLSVLEFQPLRGGRVVLLNDTSHLDERSW